MKKEKIALLLWMIAVLCSPSKGKTSPLIPPQQLILDIDYLQARNQDTLKLMVGFKMIPFSVFVTKPQVYYATKNKEGVFHFEVPVSTNTGYFVVSAPRITTYNIKKNRTEMEITSPQFWQAGDQIRMQVNNKETAAGVYSKYRFIGKGAEKYTAIHAIDQIEEKDIQPAFDGNILKFPNPAHSDYSAKLELLEQYKPTLNNVAYHVIKANICFRNNYFGLIQDYYRKLLEGKELDSAAKFRAAFGKYYTQLNCTITKEGLENSIAYLDYSYRKTKCKAILEDVNNYSDKLFQLITDNYDGELRSAMILWYFRIEPTSLNNQKQFAIARKIFEGTPYIDTLKSLEIALPGRIIGNYSLADMQGKIVNLNKYRDKVVFIDFWFTGCGGCKSYFENTLSKAEQHFKDSPDVVFISISIDYDAEKWKASVQSGAYTSGHAINLNTGNQSLKHPIIVDNSVYQYPTKMLLKKGLKLYLYDAEVLNHYESLCKEIKNLL